MFVFPDPSVGDAERYKARARNLQNSLNEWMSAYNNLKYNYDSLVNNYNKLLENERELRGEYNKLVEEYNELLDSENALRDKYNKLVKKYNKLLGKYKKDETKLSIYRELFKDYRKKLEELDKEVKENLDKEMRKKGHYYDTFIEVADFSYAISKSI